MSHLGAGGDAENGSGEECRGGLLGADGLQGECCGVAWGVGRGNGELTPQECESHGISATARTGAPRPSLAAVIAHYGEPRRRTRPSRPSHDENTPERKVGEACFLFCFVRCHASLGLCEVAPSSVEDQETQGEGCCSEQCVRHDLFGTCTMPCWRPIDRLRSMHVHGNI